MCLSQLRLAAENSFEELIMKRIQLYATAIAIAGNITITKQIFYDQEIQRPRQLCKMTDS